MPARMCLLAGDRQRSQPGAVQNNSRLPRNASELRPAETALRRAPQWPRGCPTAAESAAQTNASGRGTREHLRRSGFLFRGAKEEHMRRITAIAATAFLVASSACGYAQTKGTTTSPGSSRGASEFSPGDQMRDRGGPTPGSRGASEFSPGDQKRDQGMTGQGGASEFSPGDRMNDKRGR